MLTDIRWELLLQIMKSTGRVYDKTEHRMTFEGILYRMRTGIPWRDLPSEFGEWSTVYRRFNLWSKKGVLDKLFRSLSTMADFEWVFLDGSIVRAHQHSTGAALRDPLINPPVHSPLLRAAQLNLPPLRRGLE